MELILLQLLRGQANRLGECGPAKYPRCELYLSRIYLRLGVGDRLELVLKLFAASHRLTGLRSSHHQQ